MKIGVTSGGCFEPMELSVHVFQPKDNELLSLYRMTIEAEGQSSQLVCQRSAPVGLMIFSLSDMKATCKDHIEKMLRNPAYALQTTAGDPTEIPHLILDIILKYYFTTHVSIDLVILSRIFTNGYFAVNSTS